MQKLLGRVRAAVQKYDMIADGDRIAVGVSGGKDSVALLAALAKMRDFYPKRYSVTAISLDMRYGGEDTDYSAFEALCRSLKVPFIIRRTQLAELIFEHRKEENPCSLCAKMRRGILHNAAKEAGCNKLALGHHMDDAAETFLMNLLRGGTISCFCPVTYLTEKDLYVIRPMILTREAMIAGVVKRCGLPVIESRCPVVESGERQRMKELLYELDGDYKPVREKIIGAMQRSGLDGW